MNVNMENDQNGKFTNDDIFKPRKKRVSEFKSLPWPKQMYSIQRYLETGMDPYFMVESAFRSTRRDFRQMIRDHYIVDKEQQVLRKLVNLRKWENGKFNSKSEFLTDYLPYHKVWLAV